MTTKAIAWGTGSGNITLTYTGQGNDSVSISSDINEGIDRAQSIKVETTAGNDPKRENILIKQVGLREVFTPTDGEFVLADGGTFNTLK